VSARETNALYLAVPATLIAGAVLGWVGIEVWKILRWVIPH
jgi:hypothetical protein